jgi:translocation and assembly module TamB
MCCSTWARPAASPASGGVQRGADEKGLGTAEFTLHTDRFDLQKVYGSMKPTKIAGDLRIANTQDTQTLNVNLSDAGMRLVAEAALNNNVLDVREARLTAGRSSVRVSGNLNLLDKKPFKASAVASRFNPADFGNFPQADVNAEINASGALAPQWQVAADFKVDRAACSTRRCPGAASWPRMRPTCTA